MSKVLDLFDAGFDTQDIARFLTIRESEAYNLLAKDREEERVTRLRRMGRNPEGKILYAGAE